MRDPVKDPKPGPLERVASAFGSSDLRLLPRHTGDADVLVASGLASKQLGEMASRLSALHNGGTQRAYKDALDALGRMVWRENNIKNWRLNGRSQMKVTELSLAHYMSPVCPHCKGRGKIVVDGTPYLSANICTHCRGTGERAVQRRHHEEITTMIDVLKKLMEVYAGGVGRRLR